MDWSSTDLTGQGSRKTAKSKAIRAALYHTSTVPAPYQHHIFPVPYRAVTPSPVNSGGDERLHR